MRRTDLQDFRRTRACGFSMIEFLMAAFILAIGLLGLTMLQSAALTQAAYGRGRATAVYIADWILQRAQVEGQMSYFAKTNSLTSSYTALFTDSALSEGTLTTYGTFNVDGDQLTRTGDSTFSTTVTDANKLSPVYTASWSRRATVGAALPSTGAQAKEFVVNVTWNEGLDRTGTSVPKHFTMSRIIRY